MDLPDWISTESTIGAGIVALLGTVGIVVKARSGLAASNRRALAKEHAANAATVPSLVERMRQQDERIDAMVGRLDRKDEEIGRLTAETAECHRSHDECRRRTDELSETVDELQAMLARRDEDVTQRVHMAVQREVRRTPTPPGAWRADKDTSRQTPVAERGEGE